MSLWEALAEPGGVGDIVQEEGAVRDSGQCLHLKEEPRGMLGNARDGPERQEENQKVIAPWKPRGESFQKDCRVSSCPHLLNDAGLLCARFSTYYS